ncbi:MAG: LptF/LptG family permease [Ignavibacterium sp.]|uniref:LptF/LptG family permease n=1 Tax=Ignavibacterium sp. TaxID=2651167 RepID=UPI004049993F
MRIKILDRYLIKQFLQTILFGLLAFTLIFVVIDAMENLDDFIDQSVPTLKILHYYFVFSPEIIRLMTPVAVLFAALFTAGKAANLSELTAIKASGVSLFRFMLPFIVTTFLISLFSIYFGGYLVPMANKTKINIEQVYLKKNLSFAESNIYFQDSKTRIISISYFDSDRNRANRISIQDFSPDDYTNMTRRIDAVFLQYDSSKNKWIAENGVERIFYPNKQEAKYFTQLEIDKLNFLPEDLTKKQRKTSEMNLAELRELIDSQLRAGNDPTSTLIEYHSRFAFAATNLIVVLFGLPISANKRKGGLAVQVGINILVTFIYLVFMKISQAFGKNGALDPVLTAWFANIIFLIGAVYNLFRARL